MVNVDITNLKNGMILADDVKSDRGQILFEKGTVLDSNVISRLRFYGIESLYVEEDSVNNDPQMASLSAKEIEDLLYTPPTKSSGSKDIEYEENKNGLRTIKLSSPTGQKMHRSLGDSIEDAPAVQPAYQQSVRQTEQFRTFQMDYAFALNEVQALFKKIMDGKEPVFQDEMQAILDRLYKEDTSTLQTFDMLHNMRSADDPVYSHSLDVALISRFIGKWLKLSVSDQICLGICGLMHDIGKLDVPANILNKPGKLNEEELATVRRHPLFGFNRLKKLDIDPRIKKAALQHHERNDGNGYPLHRTSTEVHPFAQIVAIADVYDATTAKRSYRNAFCPFDVIDSFEREGISRYNTQILLTFLENIAQTYQNNRVILNDGRSADIAILNKHRYSRPVIRFFDGSFLDLSQSTDIWIQSVL